MVHLRHLDNLYISTIISELKSRVVSFVFWLALLNLNLEFELEIRSRIGSTIAALIGSLVGSLIRSQSDPDRTRIVSTRRPPLCCPPSTLDHLINHSWITPVLSSHPSIRQSFHSSSLHSLRCEPPQISTGRGGAGNAIRSPSRNNATTLPGIDPTLQPGAERGRSAPRGESLVDRVFHTGRGGAGNTRSPSKGGRREEEEEGRLEERLVAERRGREALGDVPYSTGRGGAGEYEDEGAGWMTCDPNARPSWLTGRTSLRPVTRQHEHLPIPISFPTTFPQPDVHFRSLARSSTPPPPSRRRKGP